MGSRPPISAISGSQSAATVAAAATVRQFLNGRNDGPPLGQGQIFRTMGPSLRPSEGAEPAGHMRTLS